MANNGLTRREFLKRMGMGTGGALLLANGGLPSGLLNRVGISSFGVSTAAAQPYVELLAGDVTAFALDSNEWEGDFGFVTYRLHEALYNGESAYYIRSDASSQEFAAENGLVFVPLLASALAVENATSPVYTFANGAAEQLPVLSTVPSAEDYNPAWQVNVVTFNGTPTLLDSQQAILDAEANGDITVEAMPLVVNYPIVKWGSGELVEDPEKIEALGGGPLVAPVNTDLMEVSFKLHQCYPGSRYIITDTSAVPMAPMMSIAPSERTQLLVEANATDEIWVFSNGIPGPGVMGFQPAIFDHQAGHPIWSPFWHHFTAEWNDESQARLLTTSDEIRELEASGELTIYKGVPAMDQSLPAFVVNCPAPIKAANTFQA